MNKVTTTNGVAVSDPGEVLDRLDSLLTRKACDAWHIFHVLSFMHEALPVDEPNDLPVQCTIYDLREQMGALAASLMDIVSEARHG